MTQLDLLHRELDQAREAKIEAERIIEQKNRELYNAELVVEFAPKSKSEFLANMNHELRTPLNGILGFCDILISEINGGLTDGQLDCLLEIKNSGTRLAKTFDQIMSIASLEDGTASLNIQEIDLRGAVADMLAAAKARAKTKGLQLIVDIESDLPPIKADSTALLKMLFNLMDNALKFSPEGRKVLFLSYEKAAGAIQLDVIDQGIGMSEEELKYAAVPFHQVDGGLARRHDGVGLGLSIVKKLAKAQSAEFHLFSVPNTVTRASIIFPSNG